MARAEGKGLKRGTPQHPKTLHLASLLGLERWGAVGVLESLWHFTASYAKRGDVGRFDDATIAQGIGWTGASTLLVSSLHAAGWLDRCRCHRLRIHDWPHHADQTIHRSEEVKKLGLIECYNDASSVLAGDEQHASQPTPTPTPTPEPKKERSAPRRVSEPKAEWPTKEAIDDWIEATEGVPPAPRIVRSLTALVRSVVKARDLSEAEAWGRVRPYWRKYLAKTPGGVRSPEHFARDPRQVLDGPNA